MADSRPKTTTTTTTTAVAVKPTPAAQAPAPAPRVLRASESSNAAIHQLLAELETARLSGDAATVARIGREIAALGYAS